MKTLVPSFRSRNPNQLRDWICQHALVVVSCILAFFLIWSFPYLERLECRWCGELVVRLDLDLDRITFKIDKGSDFGLLDDIAFEAMEITRAEAVRINARKIVQSGKAHKQGGALLELQSDHGDAQVTLDQISVSKRRDSGASLGEIQLADGTKVIVQGYTSLERVIRLSFRTRTGSDSVASWPITIAYPTDSRLKVDARNVSLKNSREFGLLLSREPSEQLVDFEVELDGNTVELVPARDHFSLAMYLPSQKERESNVRDFLLTHKPIPVSELDFTRLDQTQTTVTTIRQGTVVFQDFKSKEYKLHASDYLVLPRDSRLLIRELLVRNDGLVHAVIEGTVPTLSIGSMVQDKDTGRFKVVSDPLMVTYGDWLGASDVTKQTLFSVIWLLLTAAGGWILNRAKKN